MLDAIGAPQPDNVQPGAIAQPTSGSAPPQPPASPNEASPASADSKVITSLITVPGGTTVPSGTTVTAVDSQLASKMEKVVDVKAVDVKGADEPLLRVDGGRFTLFPIRYPDVYRLYKQMLASTWFVEEVDLGSDMTDFEKMTPNEQYFIKHVLAFFASSDLIVMDNLAARFMAEIQIPEAKCFYAAQVQQEAVHSETYATLLSTYVRDSDEQARLFGAIETMPAIKKKAEWAMKWITSDRPFAERLAAFAAFEGIGFCGSFCAIFWLKKRGKMPGLTFSNELISRDESLHTEHATLLFSHLKNKPTQETIHAIIRSAVDAEADYICESLPVALIGMNSTSMKAYIEFTADRLLDALGYDKIYHSANPFDFMEMISMVGKTNFFEKRVGDYQRANVMARAMEKIAGASQTTTAPSKNDTPTKAPDFVSDLDF